MLAGVDVGPPLESVVGPTSCYLVDFQRWTDGCTFAAGEPTLRPPAKMTLGRPLLTTDYRLAQRCNEKPNERFYERGQPIVTSQIRHNFTYKM